MTENFSNFFINYLFLINIFYSLKGIPEVCDCRSGSCSIFYYGFFIHNDFFDFSFKIKKTTNIY